MEKIWDYFTCHYFSLYICVKYSRLSIIQNVKCHSVRWIEDKCLKSELLFLWESTAHFFFIVYVSETVFLWIWCRTTRTSHYVGPGTKQIIEYYFVWFNIWLNAALLPKCEALRSLIITIVVETHRTRKNAISDMYFFYCICS